MQNIENKITNL